MRKSQNHMESFSVYKDSDLGVVRKSVLIQSVGFKDSTNHPVTWNSRFNSTISVDFTQIFCRSAELQTTCTSFFPLETEKRSSLPDPPREPVGEL